MSSFLSTPPVNELTQFCQRWKIHELAVFGSALRNDFSPSSDVDILVTFAPDADWGLLDHVRMELELQTLMNRKVDLMTKRALERSSNWVLRSEILRTAQILFSEQRTIYATG